MATVAERVLFHVGMPKTGSTAIQRTLAANRANLKAVDIAFPKALAHGGAHHALAWSASLDRIPREGVPPLTQALQSLSNDVLGAEAVLLSSEALFHLPLEEWLPITQWARSVAKSVGAVVYVRPPADFHEGWYRQLVKSRGYASTFREHLRDAPIISTPVRIGVLEEVFGRGNLEVRPYLRDIFPNGDVVGDFCTHAGIDAAGLERSGGLFTNPSLDAELTEFKALLHKDGEQQSPRLERVFIAWSKHRSLPYRSLHSTDSWNAFVAQTREQHNDLCVRYGLPEDLADHAPRQFTDSPMSQQRFHDLHAEFHRWYAQDEPLADETDQGLLEP